MRLKKLLCASLSVMMVAGALTACGSSAASDDGSAAGSGAANAEELTGSITAAGSSALKPLADDAADAFNEKYPDLKQVSEGTVNIGNSDVEAAEKLDAAKASALVDHRVCVVTMAPIVNRSVTAGGVKDLTTQQLTDIFTGKITNWKEVGGADEAIVLVTRPESSGTRATFKKYAIGGAAEASNKSMETDDSGVLLKNVKDTKGAIGYVALSYLVNNPGVDTLSLNGVAPTLENTYAGKYPVWTYEHMYTKGEPDKTAKAFLEYIMSDEYGKKMESLGYGVSSKMQVKEH